MPTLQLVFDPSVPLEQSTETISVDCSPPGSTNDGIDVSSRGFLSPDYEEQGREIGLWWLGILATPIAGGSTLHDIFEWDGVSSLWFTDIPFLYPEDGILLRLMIAVRTLQMLEAGEVSEVCIAGNEEALGRVLSQSGYQVRYRLGKGSSAEPTSPVDQFLGANRRLYRWFLKNHKSHLTHAPKKTSNRDRALFYVVSRSDWTESSVGRHRYFYETIEEIHSTEMFGSIDPMVVGLPPADKDTSSWDTFLESVLKTERSIYTMSYSRIRNLLPVWNWSRHRRERLKSWLRSKPPDLFRFRAWDLSPIVEAFLEDSVRKASRMILLYEAAKRTLSIQRPRAILFKDEVYPEGRLVSAAAARVGVPTVALQHGTIYPTHWCYLMDRESRGLSRPPLPAAFGAFGLAVKQLLVTRNGFPEEIVHVVGARRFRSLEEVQPDEALRVLLSRENRPLILLAGQLHPDMKTIYDWVFRLAENTESPLFVFKPHPRDPLASRIEDRCGRDGNKIYYDGPLESILPLASLTISGHSTVLLESLWLNIPAVSVRISDEEPAAWQGDSGLIKVARSFEKLSDIVRMAMESSLVSEEDLAKAERYREEYLGYGACRDLGAIKGLFDAVL